MRTLALLVLLLLPLLVPVSAHADELLRELSIDPGANLLIQLDAGNVDVTAHDGDRLRLEARARGIGASGVSFLVTQEPGQVVLRSISAPWLSWLHAGPRVHVRAWVPRGLRLAVETAGRIVTYENGVERAFPAR